MSPEAQQCTIADACGWIEIELVRGPKRTTWFGVSPDRTLTSPVPLPDYINDLNTIAEARRALITTPELKAAFANYLVQIVKGFDPVNEFRYLYVKNPASAYDELVDTTAPQQCEALLRTLNLWRNET